MGEPTPLRLDALQAPIRQDEIDAFWPRFQQDHPELGRNALRGGEIAALYVALGCFGLIALMFLLFGVPDSFDADREDPWGNLLGMSWILAVVAAAFVIVVRSMRRWRARRTTPLGELRLARTAWDNGLDYHPGPHPVTHIAPWRDRCRVVATRIMQPAGDRYIEFANAEVWRLGYSERKGEVAGYAAIRLNVSLPQIVLDAHADADPLTPAGWTLQGTQRLSLEGDFDRRFTMYVPSGSERDALYLFTPDVMALFLDGARRFDVEINGEWLLLTTSRDVIDLDPDTWRWMAVAVTAVTAKLAQWERWRATPTPDARFDAAVARAVAGAQPVEPTAPPRLRASRAKLWLQRGLFYLGVPLATWAVLPLIALATGAFRDR